MEDHQTNSLLHHCSYFCSEKNTEELTASLLITTMELEAARLKAQEELRLKDDELEQLKRLLNTAINERNEAQNRYQALLLQYHPHRYQTTTPPPPHSAVSSIGDDGGLSSSDCEESIVSSPPSLEQELGFPVKALPEKGKLLEAVVKAGPLLQNLLLAGPLPHWRNPPPRLDTYQIPAVVEGPIHQMLGKLNKKRESSETKYQRIAIN